MLAVSSNISIRQDQIETVLVPADVGLARTGYRRPPRTAHGLGFGLEKRINRNEKQTNSVPTAPQDGWQKRRLYWLASGHCEPVPVAVLN